MLFTCFPLSVFNCPSVLCSSAHAWHKSVPNLQCKYTPSFFLQSKQNLFSDDDDEEEDEEEEEEEGANTDSCIVWRMNKFRGPIFLRRPLLPLRPFVFPVVVIVVVSPPATLAWVIFSFFFSPFNDAAETEKSASLGYRVIVDRERWRVLAREGAVQKVARAPKSSE